MSKLQRQEDEVYQVAYLNETRIDCLTEEIRGRGESCQFTPPIRNRA